ncbi:unnamed protein product [Oncorhynchus mykiss]|uniref:Ephrin RBD domain-containing protein n=1 Tax=Oncorhynchus mykiss TaxID=8022 RepID=A0A060VP86_ONCMY|nr:unnamed protein product [Oncorhynchus mykiss]
MISFHLTDLDYVMLMGITLGLKDWVLFSAATLVGFGTGNRVRTLLFVCTGKVSTDGGLHGAGGGERLPGHLLPTLQHYCRQPAGDTGTHCGRAVRPLHGQLPRLPHLRPPDGLQALGVQPAARAHAPIKFSEKFQRYSAFSLGYEFNVGHEYYYISTPTHHHGHSCLRLRVYVCCSTVSHGDDSSQTPPDYTVRPNIKIHNIGECSQFYPDVLSLTLSPAFAAPPFFFSLSNGIILFIWVLNRGRLIKIFQRQYRY